MNKNEISSILEESGMDQQKIDEILYKIENQTSKSKNLSTKADRPMTVIELQEAMQNEEDWRKQAAMAARNISDSIDA